MIGELFVKIGADFKDLEKGFQNAQKKIDTFGKNTEKFGKGLTKNLTAPILAVGGGLLAMGIKIGNTADRILDLNAITGMTTDAIQEWQFVTKEAGVSTEAVTNATQKLTKQMFSLENDSGKAAESFDKLGLNFEEFNKLSADQRIATLIDRLGTIEDETERARIGTELLGGAWQEIAPIVALGADAIADARQEARDMGAVMDGDALEAANNFRIQIEKLKTQFGVAGREIGMKFLPILTDTLIPILQNNIIPLIDKVVEFIGKWADKFMELDDKTKNIILAVIGVAAAAGPLLMVGGKLISMFALLVSPIGLVVVAIAAITAGIIYLYKTNEDFANFVLNAWEKIKTAFQFVGDIIKSVIQGDISKAIGQFEDLLFGVTMISQDRIMAIGDFLHTMRDIFNDVVDNIKMLIETKLLPTIEKLREIFEIIFDAVVPIFLDFVEFIKEQLDIILKFWNENGKQIVEAVMNIFNFIIGFWFDVYNKLLSIVKFFLPAILLFFKVTFEFIKETFSNVLQIILGLFKIFAGIFTGDWKKVWEGVKDVFGGIFKQIFIVFRVFGEFITNKFNSIRDTIFGIMSAIGSKIKETFNNVVTDIKNSINKVIDLVNGVISKFNGIKINIPKVEIPAVKILGFETPAFSVGGQSFGVPQIPSVPRLADGGIITKPTLAMIGEGGESEAVIPLSKLAGLSGNNETHIYLDGREITRSIAPKMVDMIRAKGVMA
jgi:phage-related protein